MAAGEMRKLGRPRPSIREFLISTETQTHLHLEWQRLNVREQRRHLPMQLGKERSPQDPTRPRIGKGRG
eukprot:4289193-Pleurochrysis_carterae.AAC.1